MEGLSQIPSNGQQGNNRESEEQKAQAQAQEEQMRREMMATVLDSDARERLSRISLVSPARSRQIETVLFRMAQSGQLRGRVSDKQLIDLLEQMEASQGNSESVPKISKIVYQRKTDFDDDLDF